jgi:endonuclease/exonuclease/phosphatase family metal-dependent hydrolase
MFCSLGVELKKSQTRNIKCPGNLGRVLAMVSWGYPVLIVVVWMLAVLSGDSLWFATLVLYGPRWLVLIPLVILFPLVLINNRWLLIPLIAGGLVAAGPFMGLHVPLHRAATDGVPIARVLTCNINSGSFGRKSLADLIRNTNADIVALQECPRDPGLSLPGGWQSVREGELTIWSRYPLQRRKSLQALHPPHIWPRECMLCCTIQTPKEALSFCTVHLPSPRYGLTTVLDRKTILSFSRRGLLEQETLHRQRVSGEISRAIGELPGPLVIAGDFNMPMDSPLYRDVWAGYENAFSEVGYGYGWTQRAEYRGLPVVLRIDHVLVGAGLDVAFSEVGPNIGSDHLPLITDIIRTSGKRRMSWWSW